MRQREPTSQTRQERGRERESKRERERERERGDTTPVGAFCNTIMLY